MQTRQPDQGFSLIELMIVVIIIGIVAAIAIPNFLVMRNQAREGGTKSNMHTFQLAAEDYGVQNFGVYAPDAGQVAGLLQSGGTGFRNPFDRTTGSERAWRDRPAYSPTMGTGSNVKGIVAYADSASTQYCIAGHGVAGALPLHLFNGN